MTDAASLQKPKAALRSPYEELFIYYLEGCVQEAELTPAPTYIGTWEEDGFSFIFYSAEAETAILALLASRPELSLRDRFHMSYEQWQGGRVSAFRAGRFHVRPPWDNHAGPKLVGEIAFLLDPGVVFGTGTHPTTRDCLAALESLYRETAVKTVLDLGTGTGILAIAAAELGSRRVVAVDFNRLAVQTAHRNIVLNEAANRILPVHGRAEELIDCPAELVIANIHFDVMQELLQAPGFRAKPYWILSGLLRREAHAAERLLEGGGAHIIRRWTRDHIWYTYLGQHDAP